MSRSLLRLGQAAGAGVGEGEDEGEGAGVGEGGQPFELVGEDSK